MGSPEREGTALQGPQGRPGPVGVTGWLCAILGVRDDPLRGGPCPGCLRAPCSGGAGDRSPRVDGGDAGSPVPDGPPEPRGPLRHPVPPRDRDSRHRHRVPPPAALGAPGAGGPRLGHPGREPRLRRLGNPRLAASGRLRSRPLPRGGRHRRGGNGPDAGPVRRLCLPHPVSPDGGDPAPLPEAERSRPVSDRRQRSAAAECNEIRGRARAGRPTGGRRLRSASGSGAPGS